MADEALPAAGEESSAAGTPVGERQGRQPPPAAGNVLELSPDTAEAVSEREREHMPAWGRPRRKLEGWPTEKRA